MLRFHPSGFGQQVIETSLGSMVYYTQMFAPWSISDTEGSTPLIFLHNFGGGASAYEWSKVYPAFASDYRILAPDLIGWGQSAHPVRDYQIADYLTTLAEFIQQRSHSPVTVIASSLTAALTIRLAIQQPDLFQALLLVCPSGFDDFGQGAGRRLPLQVISTPLLDRLIYALGAKNEVAVSNFLQQFLFAKPERVSQEMVEAYLASAQQPHAEYAALAFLRGDLYFDLALYMQQLTVPTVIFWGEQAQFTSVKLGKRLAQLNPQAIRDFQTIAQAGVLPHLEVPEVFIGLLQHYLHSLSVL
ncbi:MAG: alpha/beta hydrolase [Chroococcidiopsidaceae cyanobacterium CP_BM_RX_35]|nr:alpha/beta hydrolase [Chroococcidiopsidaceae cyanobacterium CP_BM_RX_35]